MKINKVSKLRLLFVCFIIAIVVYVIADIDRQRSKAGVNVESIDGMKSFDEVVGNLVEVEYRDKNRQFLDEYHEMLEKERKEKKKAYELKLAREEEERLAKIEAEKVAAEKAEQARLAKVENDKKVAKQEQKPQVVANAEQPSRGGSGGESGRGYRVETLTVTAYAPYDNQSGMCSDGNPNKTSTGSKPAHGTVAVNPKRFPYGTKFYIDGYGAGTALDTGGAMRQNSSKIDVFMQTSKEARAWGVRKVQVKIYE